MSGIFDLDNIDDLPDGIKKEIKTVKSQSDIYQKILELFDQVGPDGKLSIDQVTVALYRKYQIELERARVGRQLYYLVRKGFLLNHERRGSYILNSSIVGNKDATQEDGSETE